MKVFALGILLTLSTMVPANAVELVNIGYEDDPVIIDQDSIVQVPGGYQYTMIFEGDDGSIRYSQNLMHCKNRTRLLLGGGRIVGNNFIQTFRQDNKPVPIMIDSVAAVYYDYLCN